MGLRNLFYSVHLFYILWTVNRLVNEWGHTLKYKKLREGLKMNFPRLGLKSAYRSIFERKGVQPEKKFRSLGSPIFLEANVIILSRCMHIHADESKAWIILNDTRARNSLEYRLLHVFSFSPAGVGKPSVYKSDSNSGLPEGTQKKLTTMVIACATELERSLSGTHTHTRVRYQTSRFARSFAERWEESVKRSRTDGEIPKRWG